MEATVCCGTHPPPSHDITEAQTLAVVLLDALLDTTEGERWNTVLDTVIWACRDGNATLVGNALRAEARERLADLEESQAGSRER